MRAKAKGPVCVVIDIGAESNNGHFTKVSFFSNMSVVQWLARLSLDFEDVGSIPSHLNSVGYTMTYNSN